MDVNVSPQTLHVVVDSDPGLHDFAETLRQTGLAVSTLPVGTGLAGLVSRLDGDLGGRVFPSISLYSHARPGQLCWGDQQIDASTLARYRSVFESLGQHLQRGGDLLLYGCDLAHGEEGRSFVQNLSDLIGADVAASTNTTGHFGDWNLEYTVGTVAPPDVDLLTGLSWNGTLSPTLTSPIRVPLHWLHEDGDAAQPSKLGLYATLANGGRPEILEFDTGGSGLYATFAPGASAWWGSNWTDTGSSFSQSYDSGLTYTGDGVRTTVSLYKDGLAVDPLLTFSDVVVGQANSITRTTDTGIKPLWPQPTADADPPVNGAFFGDFGMALRPGQGGINSLASQLRYSNGVRAGFRVHASSKDPWVQFGLSSSELRDGTGQIYRLNRGRGHSSTGVPFYKFAVLKGSLALTLPASVTRTRQAFVRRIGIVLDTGASTTIHTAGSQGLPVRFTANRRGERVRDGTKVHVVADQVQRSGHPLQQEILNFKAGDSVDLSRVAVQDTGRNYLNTGILPFLAQDVVYDLQGGRLRLFSQRSS